MKYSRALSEEMILKYKLQLIEQEKSVNTVQKYIRDIYAFFRFAAESGRTTSISKQQVVRFKEALQDSYKVSSVNSMLTALNSFLKFIGRNDCCVRLLKRQRSIFREEEKELTKNEYFRLLETAKIANKERLMLVMKTICSTGIRVSELQHVTASVAKRGYAEISCKGKYRKIFLPAELCRQLKAYLHKNGLKSGCVFQTKSGKPLDRSNIWSEMKVLCQKAGIKESKVFPHNLRHVFARTFYGIEKDIVRLADVLGHSSIETARIYTVSCGRECAQKIERLGLALPLTQKKTT